MISESVIYKVVFMPYKTSSMTELYKYTGKIVLEDAPELTKFVSKRIAENLLNESKESNVVSEHDCSLEDIVDIIAGNDELKDGKHLNLENRGSRISNYILEKMCQEDEN